MDFALTDEQDLLRETARRLTEKECPPALVRACMADPSAAEPLWAELGEWVALGEGPLVDLCLFLQECGAALLPGSFFPTTALFVPLAAAIGEHDGGTGTVAMAGADGQWVLNDDPIRTFVIEADRVDRVAVVRPGPAVLFLDRADAGEARPVATLDQTRRVCELELPQQARSATPLDADVLDDLVRRWTVALAAEMVGVAGALLDRTVSYAKERVQFDRPIGTFQAIQHKLADMALSVERAVAAVYYAAMTIDAGDPDRARASHVAKASAGEAVTRAAKDAIQVHGGVGYTWEHDLHLFIRRAYASEHLLGTRAWHHDRLADLLFG